MWNARVLEPFPLFWLIDYELQPHPIILVSPSLSSCHWSSFSLFCVASPLILPQLEEHDDNTDNDNANQDQFDVHDSNPSNELRISSNPTGIPDPSLSSLYSSPCFKMSGLILSSSTSTISADRSKTLLLSLSFSIFRSDVVPPIVLCTTTLQKPVHILPSSSLLCSPSLHCSSSSTPHHHSVPESYSFGTKRSNDFRDSETDEDDSMGVPPNEDKHDIEHQTGSTSVTLQSMENRTVIGKITVPHSSVQLKQVRAEIDKQGLMDSRCSEYRFWFNRMKSPVEIRQEGLSIRQIGEQVGNDITISLVYPSPSECLNDKNQEPRHEQPTPGWEDSFWEENFSTEERVSVEAATEALLRQFEKDIPDYCSLATIGLRHFLSARSERQDMRSYENRIGKEDILALIRFFGPPERLMRQVHENYSHAFFHGVISSSQAAHLLRGIQCAFLLRCSESLPGCFVLNLNKRRSVGQDRMEQFILKWVQEKEKFVFRNKEYKTLKEFVEDPEYQSVLRNPVARKSPQFDSIAETK